MSEILWLIERTYAKGMPAQRTEFWLGKLPSDGDSFGDNSSVWTTDALKAARFPRREVAKGWRYEFHPEAPIYVRDHIFGCGTSPDEAEAALAERDAEIARLREAHSMYTYKQTSTPRGRR